MCFSDTFEEHTEKQVDLHNTARRNAAGKERRAKRQNDFNKGKMLRQHIREVRPHAGVQCVQTRTSPNRLDAHRERRRYEQRR